MNINFIKYSVVLWLLFCSTIFSQENDFNFTLQGQASAWLTVVPEKSFISQAGLRYIPDLFIEAPLSNSLFLDAELSINTYLATDIHDWKTENETAKLKAYRGWLRLSTNQFEVRAGLQKINFGSATLFRPLKWFDTIDPRDPLALTEGVYGILTRYYFEDNTNIWLWGLYDNSDIKGWEIIPTEDNGIEFGGRFQTPLFTGEAGLTYHHRKADLSKTPSLAVLSNERYVNENRYAFDGKWDVEIGLWFEGAVIQREIDISSLKYQRMLTTGADYTFNVGNGLHVLSEFFNTENSDKFLGNGEVVNFVGFSVDYPVGLFDNVSAFYYRDWTNEDNYFTLTWQRTYDNWIIYLLGFFNPKTASLNQTQSGNNALAGDGFQIMVVFNH
ncbi:MAG: hypothetical protein K8H86_08745 [Ignavibacteriaceae bacterium]|nr:hypothetical protein [Ignavibacteriaceae bacterium]